MSHGSTSRHDLLKKLNYSKESVYGYDPTYARGSMTTVSLLMSLEKAMTDAGQQESDHAPKGHYSIVQQGATA